MKKILVSILTMLATVLVFAHDPDINVTDNKDGTISVSVVYPNGDPTVGSPLYVLYDKPYNGTHEINGNLILLERLVDKNGNVTVYKPKTDKFYLYLELAEFKFHEYTLEQEDYNYKPLTEEETKIWLEKINNDKSLTKDEKDYLLGIKKD